MSCVGVYQVVDDHFKTQDPSIYAIGSIAKFSRKFAGSLGISMQFCNTFDIGAQCADLVVDQLLNGDVDRKPFRLNIDQETCVVAKLHGGMHFFYGLPLSFLFGLKTGMDSIWFSTFRNSLLPAFLDGEIISRGTSILPTSPRE